MDDLISRQTAIDAIKKYFLSFDAIDANFLDGLYTAIKLIKENVPSAQPEQRWIPVTERLPDLWDERYLVSLAWGGVGTMEYKSTGFHNYGSFSPVPIETVTAWMPLPEPYREETDMYYPQVDGITPTVIGKETEDAEIQHNHSGA